MGRVKLFCGLAIVLLYLLLQFGMSAAPSVTRKTIIAKESLSSDSICTSCPIIIGGSNVIYGIQSKVIAEDIGYQRTAQGVRNLALMGEGFNFSNYVSWLSHFNSTPSFIIYST